MIDLNSKRQKKISNFLNSLISNGAHINKNVTLKYIKQLNKNYIELIPANKKLSSKKYNISRISIQGIVIGQIRVY